MEKMKIPSQVMETMNEILARGNRAEIAKEYGKWIVIEIMQAKRIVAYKEQ